MVVCVGVCESLVVEVSLDDDGMVGSRVVSHNSPVFDAEVFNPDSVTESNVDVSAVFGSGVVDSDVVRQTLDSVVDFITSDDSNVVGSVVLNSVDDSGDSDPRVGDSDSVVGDSDPVVGDSDSVVGDSDSVVGDSDPVVGDSGINVDVISCVALSSGSRVLVVVELFSKMSSTMKKKISMLP